MLGPVGLNSGWHNALRLALGLVHEVIELVTGHVGQHLMAHRVCDGECKYFIVGNCIKEVGGITRIWYIVLEERYEPVFDGCDLVFRKQCLEVLPVRHLVEFRMQLNYAHG